MANKTANGVPKLKASGTLLLLPKDQKRLARVLKTRKMKTATYLRDIVLTEILKHEASKGTCNG